MFSSQSRPGIYLLLNRLNLLLIVARENIHHEELQDISARWYFKRFIVEFRFVLHDFMESLRKYVFALHQTLSENRANSIIGYLNKSSLRGKIRLKPEL